MLQDYDLAIPDFKDAITLDRESAYAVLWLYLARAHAGDHTAAAAELDTNEKNLKQADWPYPVAELFLGRKTPEATLAAAVSPDDRCKAQFYVGERHLLQNEHMAAKVALKAAEDTCPKRLIRI